MAAHVDRWLGHHVDDEMVGRWASRLALFDWRLVPSHVRTIAARGMERPAVAARLSLFGLFQPLFDLRPVRSRGRARAGDLLPRESGARTPGAARTLASLMRGGQIDAAMRVAGTRYAMAGAPLARTDVPWAVTEPDRLLGAILFPIFEHERVMLIERWLRPRRPQRGDANV